MSPADPTSLAQLLSGIVATFLIVILAGQKVLKGWQTNSTESSVMSILHTELTRMAEQNTKLASELSKLQLEVLALNRELQKLNSEKVELHTEVISLSSEIDRLREMLGGLK